MTTTFASCFDELRYDLPQPTTARAAQPSGPVLREVTTPCDVIAPAAHPFGMTIREHIGNDRVDVERFIRGAFASHFDACIDGFMPRLFSMIDEQHRMRGAFGLRSASSRLFVEQYLDRPIEEIIAERSGLHTARHEVIEVGHLSGNFPGATRSMIALLIRHLYREGAEWVVFTGTTVLRNAFHRIGLQPIEVAPAKVDALPVHARAQWGSYYRHKPLVLIGKVSNGLCMRAERVPESCNAKSSNSGENGRG